MYHNLGPVRQKRKKWQPFRSEMVWQAEKVVGKGQPLVVGWKKKSLTQVLPKHPSNSAHQNLSHRYQSQLAAWASWVTVLLTSNFDIFNFSTKGTTSPTTTSVAAPATLVSLRSHHLCDFSFSYHSGYSLQPVPTISSTLPTDTFLGSLPTTLLTDTALVPSVSSVLPTNTLLHQQKKSVYILYTLCFWSHLETEMRDKI